MNWLGLSLVTLLLWGTYPIFANRANAVHGEQVTMLIESIVMSAVAVYALSGTRFDMSRVTVKSAVLASIMAAGSAVGFYLFLKAIRLAPSRVSTIALLTGLYPVITVIVASVLGDQVMSPKHWLGAVLATVGLILVSI